ncbi:MULTISPECIES: RICIN domain-containing protein [unclassified Streptomyces]|uniref:RICIN domain-containing protein n=1 Tax=unclassified Streptomyces TaxID=2593676 RepID=UPI0016605D71|nr:MULTISPECIES: RICIN domain-containing protein [unclassified Streptomyces]
MSETSRPRRGAPVERASGDGADGVVGPAASHQPPRWAWWVAGVVVPLVGALATALTQTQRAGTPGPPTAQAPPPVSATAGTTAPPPASAAPAPTTVDAAPSARTPAPTTAPTREPTPTTEAPAPPSGEPPARDTTRLGGAVPPPTGTPVRIVNGNSGLCLAVPGASTGVVDLDQFGCGDHPDHHWRLTAAGTDDTGRTRYRIVNGNSGHCAAVPGASKATAVHVNQFPCGDYPDHYWRIAYEKRDPDGNPLYRIVNANSGLCLAVPGAATYETAPVNQYPCGPYADHFWRFEQD